MWVVAIVLAGAVAFSGIAILLRRVKTLPRWLRAISIDAWRRIDEDAEAERAATGQRGGMTSPRVMAIMATVAISLTLQDYIGSHDFYERMFAVGNNKYWELEGFAWWSGWRVLGYVVIPMWVLKLLGERIGDYHLSLKGFFKHLWVYGALFAAVFPAVVLASKTGAFRHTYPFYKLANRSYFDLAMWELLYAAQFVSLEFFFRGFILQGLRRACGANAIFIMIVPYCMIHFQKPMAETFGAIGAGLILGTLAMRTRSIWGGVCIHIGVAMTMDILAMRGCPPIGSGVSCRR
ncbi:MAG TPA: CPBP family intramembrane glutamic endopeptidase [Kofleriaceae bacterium]|jgi:membrane protease YdiL (CAAX protease family)